MDTREYQDDDAELIVARRKVKVFNEKFRAGSAVLVIFAAGCDPQWDRTMGPARVENTRPVVNVASRSGPVHTDTVYAVPAEIPVQRCAEPVTWSFCWKLPWRWVLGIGLLFAMALALALVSPPRGTASHVIGWEEPDDVPDDAAPVTRVPDKALWL